MYSKTAIPTIILALAFIAMPLSSSPTNCGDCEVCYFDEQLRTNECCFQRCYENSREHCNSFHGCEQGKCAIDSILLSDRSGQRVPHRNKSNEPKTKCTFDISLTQYTGTGVRGRSGPHATQPATRERAAGAAAATPRRRRAIWAADGVSTPKSESKPKRKLTRSSASWSQG